MTYSSVDTIADRAAKNQATFRDANERIETTAEDMTARFNSVPFLCECPTRTCTSVVLLPIAEYELVRQAGQRFFVLAGHEVTDVEGVEIARIVEQRDGYSVMDKVGRAGEVAKALDPRGEASAG